MGGHQPSALSFIQAVLENLFYCFMTQKHCSFHDVYKMHHGQINNWCSWNFCLVYNFFWFPCLILSGTKKKKKLSSNVWRTFCLLLMRCTFVLPNTCLLLAQWCPFMLSGKVWLQLKEGYNMPIITGYYFRYRPPLSSLMPMLKTRITILPKIFSGLRRKWVSNFFYLIS